MKRRKMFAILKQFSPNFQVFSYFTFIPVATTSLVVSYYNVFNIILNNNSTMFDGNVLSSKPQYKATEGQW